MTVYFHNIFKRIPVSQILVYLLIFDKGFTCHACNPNSQGLETSIGYRMRICLKINQQNKKHSDKQK